MLMWKPGTCALDFRETHLFLKWVMNIDEIMLADVIYTDFIKTFNVLYSLC